MISLLLKISRVVFIVIVKGTKVPDYTTIEKAIRDMKGKELAKLLQSQSKRVKLLKLF